VKDSSGGSGDFTLFSPSNIPLNTWTHLAFTVENSNNNFLYILYVNGSQVISGSDSHKPVPGTATMLIGNSLATGFTSNWTGELMNVRVWQRTLSPSEIASVMNLTDLSENSALSTSLQCNVPLWGGNPNLTTDELTGLATATLGTG